MSSSSSSAPAPNVYSLIKGRFGNQLFQFWGAAWVATCLGRRTLAVKFARFCYLDPREFPNMRQFVQLEELPPHPLPPPTQQQGGRGRRRGRPGGPKGPIIDHHHVYKYGMSHGVTKYDPDAIVAEERNASGTADVHMAAYNETYRYVKAHEAWIKALYARRSMHLGPLPVVAIHLRLGDLTDQYQASADAYAAFAARVLVEDPVARAQPEVLIVSEDPGHPRVAHLVSALRRAISRSRPATAATAATAVGNVGGTRRQVVRVHGHLAEDDDNARVQADFDVFYRANVVLMANSTFTWWPAFLNPFAPRVYAAISETQPFSGARNQDLFVNGPQSWRIFDMDKAAMVSRVPAG